MERLAPDSAMRRIRTAFWTEHDRALGQGRLMNLEHVIRGRFRELDDFRRHLGVIPGEVPDCNEFCEYFNDECIQHAFPRKLILYRRAYYSLPIPTYEHMFEEAISTSLERLRAILDLPCVDQNGKVHTATAKLILDTSKFLFERVFGAPKETMVHVQLPGMPGFKSNAVPEAKQLQMTPEQLDQEIAKLEAKVRGR